MTTTLAPVAPASPTTGTTGVTLSIARQSLKTALGKLAAAVDSSSKAHAVAQHIRFDVAPGRLTLTATDFEAFVRLSVSCEATGEASALLPAKRLAEIVGALPPAPVSLSLSPTRAVITAGRSRHEMPTMPVDDFPPLPTVAAKGEASVQAAVFLEALERAAVHASTEDARPALNTVRLEPAADALTVIGLDGHRMVIASLAATDAAHLAACSLHRSTPPLLARLFSGLSDEARLSLAIDDFRLTASIDDAMASVRLVDLPYPDHRPTVASVVPTRVLVVDRVAFASSVRRVALAANDTRRITLTISDEIAITAADAKKGTAADVVAIEEIRLGDRTPFTIAMHAGWVLDALDVLSGTTVTLAIASLSQPVLFRAADAQSDGMLVLAQSLRPEI